MLMVHWIELKGTPLQRRLRASLMLVITRTPSPDELQVISQDSVMARGFDNLQTAVDHAGSLGEQNSYRIANSRGLGGGAVVGAGIPAMDLDRYLGKGMARKVSTIWGDLSR